MIGSMYIHTADTPRIFKVGCGVISVLLAGYSLCFSSSPLAIPVEIRYAAALLILVAFTGLSLFQRRLLSFTWESCFLACLFALFTLTGSSYALFNDGRLFTSTTTIPSLLGYISLFYIPLTIAFNAINQNPALSMSQQAPSRPYIKQECNATTHPRFQLPQIDHPWIAAAALILLAWSFYIAIFFPGIAYYDGLWQLSQFYGFTGPSAHHPFLATIIMGLVSLIGAPFGPTAQFACYTLIQIGLTITLLSFLATYIYQLPFTRSTISSQSTFATGTNLVSHNPDRKGNTLGWAAFTLFIMANPLFAFYAMSLTKDMPYALAISCMTILILDKASGYNCIQILPERILFITTLIILVSFRNEGTIIAAISSGALLACSIKNRRKFIIITTATVIITALACTSLIFPHFGVARSSRLEMMAIPLQQISREASEHPESFTPNERATMSQILKPGLTIEDIGHRYNSGNTDYVKSMFEPFFSTKSFASVWLRHFLLHPETYITATIASTYGYLYPFRTDPAYGSVFDLFQWLSPEIRHLWHDTWLKIPDDSLSPQYPHALDTQRSWFLEQCRKLYSTPFLNLIPKPATYVWIGLLAVAFFIRRGNWKIIWAFVPSFLVLGICFLSPINESIRYALPLVFTTPLLFAVSLHR